MQPRRRHGCILPARHLDYTVGALHTAGIRAERHRRGRDPVAEAAQGAGGACPVKAAGRGRLRGAWTAQPLARLVCCTRRRGGAGTGAHDDRPDIKQHGQRAVPTCDQDRLGTKYTDEYGVR